MAGRYPADVRHRHAAGSTTSSRSGSAHDVFVSVVGNSHFHLPVPRGRRHGRLRRPRPRHPPGRALPGAARPRRRRAGHAARHGQARRSPAAGRADRRHAPAGERRRSGRSPDARACSSCTRPPPRSASRPRPGVALRLLPFANYRRPREDVITARCAPTRAQRLGFDERPSPHVHLASFGFVDIRTKLTDVVVESAAWLSQWGHRVSLHLVGSRARRRSRRSSLARGAARRASSSFEITGYVSDETVPRLRPRHRPRRAAARQPAARGERSAERHGRLRHAGRGATADCASTSTRPPSSTDCPTT